MAAQEVRRRRLGGPSRLAGDLARMHGHERALVGLHLVHERDQIRPRVALDVELNAPPERREQRGNLPHVGRGDVTGVGARMHGDAGRASGQHTFTASITEGVAPPRELRSVAILLTLTERLIIEMQNATCKMHTPSRGHEMDVF